MQQVSSFPNALRLDFPSTMADVDKASQQAKCFLLSHPSIPEPFSLLLALREALTNAVKHGNRDNPALSVECLIMVCENELVITIRDQGMGFDWQARTWTLPQPENESGRGLAIIKACFDKIELNETGNEITLRKILGQAMQEAGSRLHL